LIIMEAVKIYRKEAHLNGEAKGLLQGPPGPRIILGQEECLSQAEMEQPIFFEVVAKISINGNSLFIAPDIRAVLSQKEGSRKKERFIVSLDIFVARDPFDVGNGLGVTPDSREGPSRIVVQDEVIRIRFQFFLEDLEVSLRLFNDDRRIVITRMPDHNVRLY